MDKQIGRLVTIKISQHEANILCDWVYEKVKNESSSGSFRNIYERILSARILNSVHIKTKSNKGTSNE